MISDLYYDRDGNPNGGIMTNCGVPGHMTGNWEGKDLSSWRCLDCHEEIRRMKTATSSNRGIVMDVQNELAKIISGAPFPSPRSLAKAAEILAALPRLGYLKKEEPGE